MCQFNTDVFMSPENKHAVLYSWVWNSPVTREESEKQIDDFYEAGIRGLYILPLPKEFRPKINKTFLEPDYLSDEFMALINHAVSYAIGKGMMVWLYDEGGWPSGGACSITAKQNSDAQVKIVDIRVRVIRKGEKISYDGDVLGVFCGKTILSDGFCADNDTEIIEYYIRDFEEHPNMVNIANASVTETFLKNTYERYRECIGDAFGKEVFAIFTDEPMILEKAWIPNFEKVFFDEYGYDLTEYLPVIYDETLAETKSEEKARIDFGLLLGKIFKRNYFEKVHSWCMENGIKFSGHINIDHSADGGVRCRYHSVLNVLRDMDIPGIDVIWQQIKKPENDEKAVSEGDAFFPRLASSATRQNGNKYAVTESFGVYGEAVTPDEMRYVINYQAARGINIFNFMNCSYGKERGLPFVESPIFISEKPGFFSLKHLNDYVARLSYIMSLGTVDGYNALYIPVNDIYAGGKTSKDAIATYSLMGEKLEKSNVNFDIIDDEGIRKAIDLGYGLKIGDAIYKSIIVPCCSYMPCDVKEKIKKYERSPIINDVVSDNEDIIIRCRNLENGKIVFAFNQSGEKIETVLTTSLNHKNIYKLNLVNGEIYKEENMNVSILSGESVVFLLTDCEYDHVTNEVEFEMVLDNPVCVSAKRFTVEDGKMKNISCEFSEISDEYFSGEVEVKYHYELPFSPKVDDRFLLLIESENNWGRAYVKDDEPHTFGISPMQVAVSGDKFEKKGEIIIKLANTCANEVRRKREYFMTLPIEEYGPYRDIQYNFEKNAPKIKVGKLVLQKLR